jgi:DNA-binding MarR family transcriptional regulator
MEETAEYEVTPVQYSALLAVRNHAGIDQTILAKFIAFDRSTIGDVVQRLENKCLIRRDVSDADRRTKSLYITPSGRQLLIIVSKAVNAAQNKSFEPSEHFR